MCDFKNRTLSLKSFKLYNDNEVKEMERKKKIKNEETKKPLEEDELFKD